MKRQLCCVTSLASEMLRMILEGHTVCDRAQSVNVDHHAENQVILARTAFAGVSLDLGRKRKSPPKQRSLDGAFGLAALATTTDEDFWLTIAEDGTLRNPYCGSKNIYVSRCAVELGRRSLAVPA